MTDIDWVDTRAGLMDTSKAVLWDSCWVSRSVVSWDSQSVDLMAACWALMMAGHWARLTVVGLAA